MTYSELLTQIESYLHRSDLTAKLPDFVALAESFLFREVSVKLSETIVTGTTTSGYATLPADFLSVSRVTITSNGATRSLDYIAIADVPTSVDAYPSSYSLEAGNLRIWGADTGQAYTLTYVPKLVALSALAPTNWLLTNAADLYLYTSALEGAKYIRDDAQIQTLNSMVGPLLEIVKRFANRQAVPTTGGMQIKTRR